VSILAGPIAEELLGGGDAFASIGELIEASVFAFRAKDLDGHTSGDILGGVLLETFFLVEDLPQIQTIAEMLERRKRITSREPSVRKVLASMPRDRIVSAQLSAAGDALMKKIEGGFDELATILVGVLADGELPGAGS
jgi:hypothetical protein